MKFLCSSTLVVFIDAKRGFCWRYMYHFNYGYWWSTRIFPFAKNSYLHRTQWTNTYYFYFSRVKLLVFESISHPWEIHVLTTFEDKILIPVWPCNIILYFHHIQCVYSKSVNVDAISSKGLIASLGLVFHCLGASSLLFKNNLFLCRMKGAHFLYRCGTSIYKVCVMTCGIIALLKKPKKCLHLSFIALWFPWQHDIAVWALQADVSNSSGTWQELVKINAYFDCAVD